jgi:hypothetical protein
VLPDDLAALNVALHNLGQDVFPVPVVFVGAGLPSLPAVLADATGYAERLYDYRQIGLLDVDATVDALTAPARANGVGKKRTTELSVNRRDLIRSGQIYTPERGLVAFTVPGMADFIARQGE